MKRLVKIVVVVMILVTIGCGAGGGSSFWDGSDAVHSPHGSILDGASGRG